MSLLVPLGAWTTSTPISLRPESSRERHCLSQPVPDEARGRRGARARDAQQRAVDALERNRDVTEAAIAEARREVRLGGLIDAKLGRRHAEARAEFVACYRARF